MLEPQSDLRPHQPVVSSSASFPNSCLSQRSDWSAELTGVPVLFLYSVSSLQNRRRLDRGWSSELPLIGTRWPTLAFKNECLSWLYSFCAGERAVFQCWIRWPFRIIYAMEALWDEMRPINLRRRARLFAVWVRLFGLICWGRFVLFVFLNPWWNKKNSTFTVIYLWGEEKWNWKCLSLGDVCKVLSDDVAEKEMGRKDEEAISAFQVCELNRVLVMTTVKHSDFFCIFRNKSSIIISSAVPNNL